jgi:hypothetical protein
LLLCCAVLCCAVQVIGGGLRDSFLVAGVAFKKTFSYAGFEQQPKAFDSEWRPVSLMPGAPAWGTYSRTSGSHLSFCIHACSYAAMQHTQILQRVLATVLHSKQTTAYMCCPLHR